MAEKVYTREFAAMIDSKLPKAIVAAMADYGWNALGIYELVQEQRLEHRRMKLPVFVSEKLERERTQKG